MGDAKKDDLRVGFDSRLKLKFVGSKVTSDAGLLAYRELDEVLGLTELGAEVLSDLRLPAVENSLALVLNEVHRGRCTIEQVVRWMCDGPARVWDIVNKGRIAVGYDADLVLVDLKKTATVRNEDQQTKCGWSPWHGEVLTGWPVTTWVMGRKVYYRGQFDQSVRGAEAIYDHARGGYWATR